MAYYTKGARSIGDVDWAALGNQVASQVLTKENVQAASQAAGGLIQNIAQQFGPKPPPPPPPVKKEEAGAGTMILYALGALVVVGGGYLAYKSMASSSQAKG